jgi:hypothetical protein
MTRIAKSNVHDALKRAAAHLKDAGGPDGRVSRKDIAEKLKTLDGTERALVDMFFRFVDARDAKKGATVTHTDVDQALAYAKEKLVDKYDVNQNGLSKAEIEKMSTTGKLAVALAKELRAIPSPPSETGFDRTLFALEVKALTDGLTLMSESDAMLKPISANLPVGTAFGPAAVRAAFAAEHTALKRDVYGYDNPNVFDLATAHVEERGFTEWFGRRRVTDDPDDPDSVVRADKHGALVDHLAATLTDLRVFRFSDQTSSSGRVAGSVSVFVVGRTPDGHMAGVFTASVET